MARRNEKPFQSKGVFLIPFYYYSIPKITWRQAHILVDIYLFLRILALFLKSHVGIIGEASVGDAHQEMWH